MIARVTGVSPADEVLYDADRLQARVRFDGRTLSERIELAGLVSWVGAPGAMWRLLTFLRGVVRRVGGVWPFDVVPFATRRFAGYLRWTGPGVCRVEVATRRRCCTIKLRLPDDEAGRSISWQVLGGISQDEPAPELEL